MITQTIPVTAEHIRRGTPQNCSSCPIALAILDACPDVSSVSVHCDIVMVTRWAGPDLAADLPSAAQHFVSAFDQPDQWIGPSPVHPFGFEVTWLTAEEELAQ